MRRRGITFVELLVTSLLSVLVLGWLFQMFISMHNAYRSTDRIPEAQRQALDAVNILAHELRRAPTCDVTLGCTGTNKIADSAFMHAYPLWTQFHIRPQGGWVRYEVVDGGLQRITAGGNTRLVAEGQVTLTLKYLVNASSGYNVAADPDTLTWVNAVTDDNLKKQITAVKISVQVDQDGYTGSYSTTVRLRNSPKKISSTE